MTPQLNHLWNYLTQKGDRLIILCIFLSLLILVADLFVPLGIAFGVSYLIVILLTLWLPDKKSTLIAGLSSSILVLTGFLISLPEGIWWMVVANRMLSFVAIWVTVLFVIKLKSGSDDLRKSEHQFRTLFESVAESIIAVDSDNIIRLANSRIREMFGYDKTELVGQHLDVLIPGQKITERPIHKSSLAERTSNDSIGSVPDLYAITKDGSTFPVDVSLNQYNHEGQQMTLAVITNITERKNFIDMLKREKETARMYLEVAGTMFVVIDKDQKVTLINRKGCEILGYEEHEIIGKNWFDNFIPIPQRQRVKTLFEDIIRGSYNGFESYENEILTSNGNTRLISWNNTVIHDTDGNIISTLSSGKDITKQKEAEENLIKLNTELEQRVADRTRELEESQRLYRLIARNFPNGVINVLDKDLNYVFVEGMEMYKRGISGEMLVGSSFLDRINPEIRSEIKRQLLNVLSGENTRFELEIEKKIYAIHAVGLYDNSGVVNQILMVSQNISNLKKAEEDMHRNLEREIYLNELKSRFLSTASHEFRTPLTSIMNSTTLLSKYIDKPGNEDKQRKHIRRIRGAILNLIDILENFLSRMDRLEEGKVEIRNSEFAIPEFLSGIVDDLQGMSKKNQKITFKHEGNAYVTTDKPMFKNIINNLLNNAIKYSPEGSNIRMETNLDNGDLKITVQDQGIGIPEDEQKHLFERFYRARNAVNLPGTGLGLNIIKKYLDIVGGEISFESKLNEGTTFTVHVPIDVQLRTKETNEN